MVPDLGCTAISPARRRGCTSAWVHVYKYVLRYGGRILKVDADLCDVGRAAQVYSSNVGVPSE